MTPVEASLMKNEAAVYRNLYPDKDWQQTSAPQLKVGDRVRITKKKLVFEKDICLGGQRKCLQCIKFSTQTHPRIE